MKNRYVLLTMLSSILIYGCGGSSSDSGKTTVLEGTWIRGCSLDSKLNVNDPNVYSVIKLTFSGKNIMDVSDGISVTYEETAKVKREINTYQDLSCSVPTDIYTPPDVHPDNWRYPISTVSGQFVLFEDISTTGGLQATQISFYYNTGTDYYNIFYINADTLFFGNPTFSGRFPNTLDLTQEFIKQ